MIGSPSAPSVEVAIPQAAIIEAKSTSPPTADFLRLQDKPDSSPKEKDVSLVSLGVVGKKGNTFLNEDFSDEKITPELLKKKYQRNQARGELAFLSYLMHADFQGVQLGGQELTIDIDGHDQRVNQIFGRTGDQFQCEINGQVVLINCDQILSSQIKSAFKNPAVRSLLSTDELMFVDAYLDSTSGRQKGLSEQIPVNKIQELATSAGLITTEAVTAFANANKKTVNPEHLKEGAAETDAKTAKENQAYNQKIDETLKLLEGTNVASPEAVSEICQVIVPDNLNASKLLISEQISQIQKQILELKTNNPQNPQIVDLENKQIELTNFQALMQEATALFNQGNAVENFFGQIQRGEVEPETVQKFETALKNNDGQAILNSLFESNKPKIPDKDKQKLKIPSNIKLLGGGALAIFFFLIWKSIRGKDGSAQMPA